ncbi:MAG TPA: YcxB family protein [Pyrinomonadaceae bacterium]
MRRYYEPFRMKLAGVLGALFLALGVFTGRASGDPFYLILSALGALSLVRFYLGYFVAPRRWYKHISERGEYTLQYSDAGIVFRARDIDSTLQWSLYREVRETGQFYFLVYGKDAFSVIPKRAFTSAEQERGFRALLRRHVGPELEAPAGGGGDAGPVEEYVSQSLEPPDWR